MNSLARRLEELRNMHIRLHIAEGKVVTFVDGIYQGIQDGAVILSPSSRGERTDVQLERIYAVTQLPSHIEERDDAGQHALLAGSRSPRPWLRQN